MMKKGHSTFTLVLCCAATAAVVLLAACAAIYFYAGGSEGCAFLRKLNCVRAVVDDEYIGTADWNAAADAASSGIISSLEDRWSYYMTAEEYKSYEDYSSNSTTGIGVTVEIDEESGKIRVVSVTEGSPADIAGIEIGDFIAFVEGETTEGMTLSELKAAIKAQKDDYELGIVRGDGESISVTIRNDIVFNDPVSYKILDSGEGYIRISNFEKGAAESTIAAINKLLAEKTNGIIFDVRSNPGGRLTELIDILDFILPEGDIFVSVDADGEETVYTSDESHIDCPMAVIINADTYSAAEFFAAALDEYDYAVTVGEASTGKARSQVTYVLEDGSAVHISTRNYLTPERVNLAEEGGLSPEISVPLDGETDTQLEAAKKSLS